MLLVNPGVGLSTAQVFAEWDRQDRGALCAESLERLIEAGRNDLQAPAVAIAPMIADVLAALDGAGGLRLARMSGSGATCFALFDSDAAMARAAETIRAARPGWWILETRIRSA